MSGEAILIAGGYGVVGGRIAAELAPIYRAASSSPEGILSERMRQQRRLATAHAAVFST